MQLLKSSNELISIEMPPIKKCPWCGSQGHLTFDSLEKPNGRGYPGNYLFYIKCTNDLCGAIAPYGKVDDIYRSTQEAVDKAVKIWNAREE